ncbi:unnamed protein product [Prorocentrum cordatum]|uniref:Alpha-1,3-glucosyltransferase n=1 Tax=Prorocentrum cordatum TaxID=2364126 RepID=A0ABN9XQG7_9DINO|nr:unnamed protein product [Polarella glacialis]
MLNMSLLLTRLLMFFLSVVLSIAVVLILIIALNFSIGMNILAWSSLTVVSLLGLPVLIPPLDAVGHFPLERDLGFLEGRPLFVSLLAEMAMVFSIVEGSLTHLDVHFLIIPSLLTRPMVYPLMFLRSLAWKFAGCLHAVIFLMAGVALGCRLVEKVLSLLGFVIYPMSVTVTYFLVVGLPVHPLGPRVRHGGPHAKSWRNVGSSLLCRSLSVSRHELSSAWLSLRLLAEYISWWRWCDKLWDSLLPQLVEFALGSRVVSGPCLD